MTRGDVYEAKLTDEIGIEQPVVCTDGDRVAVATHEAGHASVAHLLGKDRRLKVLSSSSGGSLGLLAGDAEGGSPASAARSRRASRSAGSSPSSAWGERHGTSITAHATALAAQMVGSFGMAGSLIPFDAVAERGPAARTSLPRCSPTPRASSASRTSSKPSGSRVRAALEENRDIHAALRDALIDRDELVGAGIPRVFEKALANRN
ncbi:MAG: hypothetical protein U0V56_07330 [Actinomycetota bacterium]